ncbi:lipopolysaccharide assembly protein LapB [Rhizobacter sp. Root1221]|uniref:tetratricopeptide repeat protein n=1 Tax=Rhizobacter sp. Root1221 TaxID=1736433 RepID=UPI0012FA34DC|nr:hypothetical protein [Rhizobacter sp. Root1221]
MRKAIHQSLLGALKGQFRLSRGHIAFAFGKWQKRIFTTTVVVGLLMTGTLAVAHPSNLGDNQVFQTNNDLERTTAEVNSAYTSAEKHPGSTDAQYALAVALDRMGDLKTLRARHKFPYSEGYGAALELARNNRKSHPRTDLMGKVERLEATAAPDSEKTLWEFRDTARRYYGRARVLYQRLIALQPNNNKWQRALAVNYTKTNPGHVGIEEVRAYYQPALTILLRLVKLEPGNDEFQRDLAMAYETIADQVNSMTGSLPAEYDDALAIRMKLFRRNEENPLFVRELAVTFGKLGEALAIRGKWEAARDAVTDEFGLYQDLAARDPANMEWQHDLAAAHMDFAAIKDDNNGPGKKLEGEVLAHYAQALKIRINLIQMDPRNTEWQMDLVASHETMARFYNNRALNEKALDSYIDAQRQMSQLAQRYPNDRGWLFYQLYFYFSIGYENRQIQRWAAPLSQGGKFPEPEKFKAAAVTQEKIFKTMVGIIDTLVRMTDAPMKPNDPAFGNL